MRKIALGICSSISIYKSAEIIREFQKKDIKVRVIMTRNATEFIQPLLFEALTGEKVIVDQFKNSAGIEHISLANEISLLLIAPATANIIGKLANGIADDFLSTFYLAVKCPVVIAPSMNENMYLNPITQENLRKLKSLGVIIIEPEVGELACGVKGIGRLAEPAKIVEECISLMERKDSLRGKKILITAGPTQEKIDAVRFISNKSSGKMGYSLAREALWRGGEVILISGPTFLQPPNKAQVIKVNSALEMREQVIKNYKAADIVIMCAAVADYRPSKTYKTKIKKEDEKINIELIRNPDILEELGRKKGDKLLIGFAAETGNFIENAKKKMKKKNLDLVIVNDVSKENIGFGSDYNQVILIDKKGEIEKTKILSKVEISKIIFDKIEKLLNEI
ncbi:bifunctional phosphopantothenoylcysteine decarboxylase/phosphopantothenate--cysteine ligase CoaBC [Candidatus Aminicenantes bacterium AC-708-M15]|jgi:phosphopantothenoylcysteine decarboxylase/phosphopantothenate--cysteine ligase|nr:bifunctional phosphopantothenoylcysteine decarboxylase/phosphopantothenate--cysteine ligase CoaBC [SCandidatus Aminicenantes bacterium Aminicenantia_JdfR_composite]MCP2596363.1 bifunctional phosphopantothenoylcysteine decarboxylase/phosphopantothenate--cysteine ligase CoaBC [Candidatus Aminicenantes bacterium AC-335-G13]MCP2604108.1 bifunctional phosphopantothenoylcysteine decarboxylase/phosphopantothenate--cysteine ligase CoaBC [Candidatus Aminicenantes bacterium AC-708-M15]MCP2605397.1 bifu